MQLPSYNITLVLSDPDDKSCQFKVVLERVPREKVLEKAIPLRESLLSFEEMVEDPAIKNLLGRR